MQGRQKVSEKNKTYTHMFVVIREYINVRVKTNRRVPPYPVYVVPGPVVEISGGGPTPIRRLVRRVSCDSCEHCRMLTNMYDSVR